MKKTFSLLITLALVLSFSLVVTTPVAADSGYRIVDDDGKAWIDIDTGAHDCDSTAMNVVTTIAAGIAATPAGGTLFVCPGTYVESPGIVIDKNLTIIGAGSTTTIIKPSGDTASNGAMFEVNPDVTFHISDVTLDGTGKKVWYALKYKGGGSVTNCDFKNIQYNPSGPDYNGIAICAYGEAYDATIDFDDNVDITGCTFTGIGRVGVLYFGPGITDSTYSGNTYVGKGAGDWLDYALDVGSGPNVTITGSTISGCTGVASSDGSTSCGIMVTDYYKSYCPAYSSTEATITNNNISGCTSGICVGYDNSDLSVVTISGNTMQNNRYQVDCTTNVNVDLEATLAGNTFDRAVVVRGSGIKVPTIFSNINDAIGAAVASDTIEVADGTYDEIVVIDKEDLIVQAGSKPLIQPTSAASWPNMGAVNIMADGVTFDGFEVDGSLMPGNHEVINAYGVSDVTIRNNIAHGATSGTWDGMGIVAWDWDGTKTVDRATIENNEVYDTGRMGIFCMDYDTTNSKYDLTEGHVIRGNTVHDTWLKGDDWSDAGGAIQINVGKDCTIEDNEIFDTASTTWIANYNAGIYMYGSGTGNVITCNTIRDNTAGVTLWIAGDSGIDWEGDTATSPDVFNNNIYDNTNFGARSVGTPVMIMDAEENWWGDASGPTHASNPGGTGDPVSDNVDFDPWSGEVYAPTKGVVTSTMTGTASFTTSDGNIDVLAAVAISPYPGVELPHGMFSFKVCCINPGQAVTLTITLPGPVPRGSKWWKFQSGRWYPLPIGSDNGDNIITITLTDGVSPGDADGIPGQITDPGGPGYYYSPPSKIFCDLEISSTEGGLVTTPGEGPFSYECGTVVELEASPDIGYHFVNWTGDVGTVEDVEAAATNITVDNDYSITANFATGATAMGEYSLTISSTMGGSVTTPGEGLFNYGAGTSVSLVASPANGYKFVNWTGDGITHSDSSVTTITMNGDYSIKANFGFEQTTTNPAILPEGSSSGPLACFIATAAYGTPTAEQIDVLREFRDVVLLESAAGSQFVDLYYRLSPPIADFIAGNELLRTVVKEFVVDPLVWVVEATGAVWRTP